MGRSPGFGSTACDFIALFRLAFAVAPRRRRLALPQTVTRRFIMQKVRRHPFPRRGIGLRLVVGARFQVLFTPLIEVLFIVQSPYLCAIGRNGVLSLGEWSPQLHAEFHGFRATLERRSMESSQRRLRDCHPLRSAFPSRSTAMSFCNSSRRPQPRSEDRFGLVRVRSPLLTESRLISFPAGT